MFGAEKMAKISENKQLYCQNRNTQRTGKIPNAL